MAAPRTESAAPRLRAQTPAGRTATPSTRSGAPRTGAPRTAAARTGTPRAGTPRTGAPVRRVPSGSRSRPPARRRHPAPRARTPRTGASWLIRLAVVAGATMVLATVLAALPQPPTEAGQVLPAGLTSSPQAAATTISDLTTRYRADLAAAARHDAQAQQNRDDAAAASAENAVDRAEVGGYAQAAYQRTTTQRYPLSALSLDHAAATPDVLHAQDLAEQLSTRQDRAVGRAALSALHAAQSIDRAAAAQDAADAARARAAGVLADVRELVGQLGPAVTAGWAALGTTPTSAAQQTRNATALHDWQTYLGDLATSGVTPPPAAELTDPAHLPDGLAPLRDAAGTTVPGVAVTYAGGRTVAVVSAETVAAVSAGFSQLGKPYLAGRSGPDGYDCGGLTATAWTSAGFGLPADLAGQWAQGTPVPSADLQVGDLVFTTDPMSGLDDVGLFLGGNRVLSASADNYQVGVREVPDLTTAVRVTVVPAQPTPVPVAGVLPASCSAPPLPVGGLTATSGAWGGWANGQIPADQLCRVAGGSHRLRCDAAAAYTAMSAAYEMAFGSPLCITDSYRSLGAQVDAHERKPRITAVPGTSNHGWGLAVDLCGGVNVFGTPQTAWMTANAARFGWLHPGWADRSGSNPEAWHWEYGALL
ncbi:Cell wall-associated hydrolase, NlpC family [Modestobacter sp. DSM 44400]|uniref:NlpC/P60 family protein n=1 Tax=Modestobacter sp. DSM 44400 TaxID=1550230 RepID=UPI0008943EFD|nr:NlpC/P60 family protein [Modestobacter sp. DSM 44400]SDX88131.1 Cell wall-associated hydrolase, NlpC family [Modestobacter sp. DSM 44400]